MNDMAASLIRFVWVIEAKIIHSFVLCCGSEYNQPDLIDIQNLPMFASSIIPEGYALSWQLVRAMCESCLESSGFS